MRDDLADDVSIATLLSRVIADGKEVALAEIEVRKAKVQEKAGEAKNAIILLIAALMLASLASTALVVGALFILTPLIGPGAATAVVVGVLLLGAVLLGWLALRQLKLLLGSAKAAS